MLKRAIALSLFLATSTTAPALAFDEITAKQVMAKAVDGYIRPAYADFHAKASALADTTAKLCAAPSDAALKAVSALFGDAVESWGKVSIIAEGPVLQQNRFERVLFYPDRKSIGLKQVQALIATPDEAVTDPKALEDRSVAIQGLGAFEYVFFGSYPEGVIAEKNSFRCRYGLAIARNVEGIAAELQAAWDDPKGIANDWKNPSQGSAVYRTGEEAMQALIATPDEAVTDPKALKDRSVAIQGLGAFEYVFFGSYPEGIIAGKNSFRCRYGLAIARNVEGIAAELQAAWDDPKGIADDWKNPSQGSAVYRTGEEAMQALIGVHVHGIEMVRDQRFKPFYDNSNQKLTPNAALFRRSGNTIRVITANVEGLEKLWQVADLGVFLPGDKQALSGNIVFDYKAAATAVAKLPPPTAENLADKTYLAKLAFIDFTLKDASSRINNDVGAAVGLEAGFSFADGD